ncbi:hypothetical protein R1flu_006698 [Riccia fluitans]|uniref:K Homology domain-containing protein n=1 Tax=Riccia fluitans TaxID=41844 RepID=A0ABD1YXU5_9MARC
MDGPYFISPAKRPHSHYERDSVESNGRHKRHQTSHSRGGPPPPMKTVQDETVFRILCPGSKTGSVIGKQGSIIKSLRQETGARIKIADAVPGVDERVIIISASDRDRERGRDRDRTRDREGRERDGVSRERDGGREREGRERERDVRERDGPESRDRENLSPAQEALFRVHSRIVDSEGSNGSDEEDEDGGPSLVTTRLLVPNNQIGCLLGKGGKIIEQMRDETGAQIRILPKEQLPGCALPSDELVQIFGDLTVVKKALHAISTRLKENPPRERPGGLGSGIHGSGIYPPGGGILAGETFISAGSTLLGQGGPLLGLGPSLSGLGGGGGGGGFPFNSQALPVLQDSGGSHLSRHPPVDEELVFRILCPNEKIGSVIGKGGSIIRNLREDTGARIKVADPIPGSDERVIIISANEHPDDNISPAQEAVLHVQSRIVDLGSDQDGVITTRLLVPSNQIGCLLGRGGSIIADMRKATRANIRILAKDQLPRCALETDELVQIVGDIRVAREALIQITTRLRSNLYREKSGSGSSGAFPSSMSGLGLPSSVPLSSGYGGRHEPGSPGGMYSSLSGLGLQQSGRGSSYQSISSSPGAWGLQGSGSSAGGGSLSGYGVASSHQSGSGRYSSGGRSSGGLVTNTTVEVVIPNGAVGSIIGKSGSNIAQIRQISGAKVKLHDVRPGSSNSRRHEAWSQTTPEAAVPAITLRILRAEPSKPILPKLDKCGLASSLRSCRDALLLLFLGLPPYLVYFHLMSVEVLRCSSGRVKNQIRNAHSLWSSSQLHLPPRLTNDVKLSAT